MTSLPSDHDRATSQPRRLGRPVWPGKGPVKGFGTRLGKRPGRPGWPGRLAGAVLVATAVLVDRRGVAAVVALFVLVRPFEALFPRHRQRVRRPGLATDVAYGLAQPVLQAVTIAVGIAVSLVSLVWVPALLLRPVVLRLAPLPRGIAAFVLVDMCTYWLHRCSHEVPALWRFHAVHHSTTHLDWVSGLRNHPLEGALLAPPLVFLAAAGFELRTVGAITVVQLVLGLFLHANVRWRLRPLQRVVITPEFHHWHHAAHDGASSTNYSVLLPVWDLAFQTYRMPEDRRPERYGIEAAFPSGLAAQLREPLVGITPTWSGVRSALRHPLRTVRRAVRAERSLLRQMGGRLRRSPSSAHSAR